MSGDDGAEMERLVPSDLSRFAQSIVQLDRTTARALPRADVQPTRCKISLIFLYTRGYRCRRGGERWKVRIRSSRQEYIQSLDGRLQQPLAGADLREPREPSAAPDRKPQLLAQIRALARERWITGVSLQTAVRRLGMNEALVRGGLVQY